MLSSLTSSVLPRKQMAPATAPTSKTLPRKTDGLNEMDNCIQTLHPPSKTSTQSQNKPEKETLIRTRENNQHHAYQHLFIGFIPIIQEPSSRRSSVEELRRDCLPLQPERPSVVAAAALMPIGLPAPPSLGVPAKTGSWLFISVRQRVSNMIMWKRSTAKEYLPRKTRLNNPYGSIRSSGVSRRLSSSKTSSSSSPSTDALNLAACWDRKSSLLFILPVFATFPFILFLLIVIVVAANAKVLVLLSFFPVLHGRRQSQPFCTEVGTSWLLIVSNAVIAPILSFLRTYSVDDHLHQMNPVRLHLQLVVGQNRHGKSNELWHVVVDATPQIQHHDLCKFASANSIHTTNLLVSEDGADHIHRSFEVRSGLHQMRRTVVDEVLQGGQHVLQIELGTALESFMDELVGSPHSRRNDLGRKCTRVDDFKDFIVQVIKLVLQGDGDDGHQDGLQVGKYIWCTFEREDQSSDCLEYTKRCYALVVKEVAIIIVAAVLGLVALDQFPHNSHVSVSSAAKTSTKSSMTFASASTSTSFASLSSCCMICGIFCCIITRMGSCRMRGCNASDASTLTGRQGSAMLSKILRVTCSRTQESVGAAELREHVPYEEVFHLISDRALLAENHVGQRFFWSSGAASYLFTIPLMNANTSNVCFLLALVRAIKKLVAATSGADTSS
ncbi:ARM repeat-containing protein [Hortaea werneckii]|nr:ARM repeat-containing protein [Hortaea werneckii]